MIDKNAAAKYFEQNFSAKPSKVYFSHGRLELLGNHTDHNNGVCLVGACDIGITAAISPRDDGQVILYSKGFAPFSCSIADLKPKKEEEATSLSLVKGVLFGLKEKGYKIGGFEGAMVSDIPSGSGISSSACFESLIAKIVSSLYNEDRVSPIEMAKIGQYAENVYFGKPCGLLDQIGTSFGGASFIDFASTQEIIIEPLPFSLPLTPVLIQTKSSHDGLTSLYASIPSDMKAVANLFGKPTLRSVSQDEFKKWLSKNPNEASQLAKKRALHFFDENERVKKARDAIKNNDVSSFLSSIKSSQDSSRALLENTFVPGQYKNSPQEAVDYCAPLLPNGSCRIMGGGFAGSIICFASCRDLPSFIESSKEKFGEEAVHIVSILPTGPTELS